MGTPMTQRRFAETVLEHCLICYAMFHRVVTVTSTARDLANFILKEAEMRCLMLSGKPAEDLKDTSKIFFERATKFRAGCREHGQR